MIQLAKDDKDLQNNEFHLESQNINSARGTKNFLKRIEEDIGVQKSKYLSRPGFMKSTFKPDTLRKFRQNGGVAPTNRQADLLNQVFDYECLL